MKKIIVTIIIIVLLLIGSWFYIRQKNNYMKITSSAFGHQGAIPEKFACDGENVNPALEFRDVPDQARSLVLIMNDPDAPAGTWVHWVLWNIDPRQTEIKENTVPAGAGQGITSFGQPGYGGPCPPSGTHRYFFKLFALDEFLGASALKNADAKVLEQSHGRACLGNSGTGWVV